MYSMISRKTFWIMVLGIAAGTAIYLFEVKQERLASIQSYFPQPRIGDIYKMQRETREDAVGVFYLKIKDIGSESIYFYGSKLMMGAMHDGFLKQFDTSEIVEYTKKELAAIKQGQWNNAAKMKLQLLEIERK